MIPALHIVENDLERDRKECIHLFARVTGANRELAQWLLDHSRYTGTTVAGWLGCGQTKIYNLREWAQGGFKDEDEPSAKRLARADSRRAETSALKSQENSEDEDEDELVKDIIGSDDSPEVAPPEEVVKNLLYSIERQLEITRAYKRILRASSLGEGMKGEVSDALGTLITLCQSLQRALRPGGTK